MPCYYTRRKETNHDECLKLAPSQEILHGPSSLPAIVSLALQLLHCLIRSLRLLILWVGIKLTTFLIGCSRLLVCLIALFIGILRLRCVLPQRRPLFLQPARYEPDA